MAHRYRLCTRRSGGSWITVIIAGFLGGAVLEILRYRAGGWSRRFAGINAALDLVVVVPLVCLATTNSLLDPRMV